MPPTGRRELFPKLFQTTAQASLPGLLVRHHRAGASARPASPHGVLADVAVLDDDPPCSRLWTRIVCLIGSS
jgi:hypothetical protein